jgi:RNA polymerase sigma factor (sigma-70 family)
VDTPSDRPALDELLAQVGWMRTLARSLVADSQAAEDVVQDAWVVALGKRATVRTDLASWLRSVVRNLALRRNAREGRRPAVERGAARVEGGDPTDELRGAIERMELQRWLAEALLELPEPARSAVILRHVDGLDPGEIARRQSCSREAARQRVARGLAELRRRLDARPGGRAAWCLVLVPWTHAPRPLPLSWTTGGILMGSKALLASLVALAAVAVLWFALGRGWAAPRERAELGASLPSALLERVPDEAASETSEPRREALASARPAAPAAAPLVAPPANPLFAVLSGRVLDAAGAPVAGAEVAARRPEVGHFSVLDLEVRRNPRTAALAVTGADGRFAFELERGIPLDLAVSARGHCDERRQDCYAGEEHEIVLGQGLRVHGRVTRLADGAPIAEARVRVFQLGSKGDGYGTTSAADGRFELRTTFQTDALLEITPQRERSSDWIRLVFDATGTAEANVALPDGIEVRGRVLAADTGAPIAGAEVGEGWTFRRKATTDARGEYVLPGFGDEGAPELFARAAGFGRGQRASLPPVVDGVMRVDFELVRGHAARGRVLDAARVPLAGAYVAAVASEFGSEGQQTDWVSGRTDFAGRFELTGLSPAIRHALVASADGHATHVFDFPAEELAEPELELGDFVLGPAALLSGTVADEDGVPLPGVEVVLMGANHDRGRLRAEPSSTSQLGPAGDWYVDSREGSTDAQGRFAFGSLPAGEFRLHARADGRPQSPSLKVSLGAGELREDLVLLYPRGETIRGTLVDAEGHGLAGVYVMAELSAARGGTLERRRTDAVLRTDADGAFEFAGLPAGTWSLDFRPYELDEDPDSPWLPLSLTGVESGGEPLRAVLPRGASIRGRLVDARGAALIGYYVLANRPGPAGAGGGGPGGASGEDGSFRLEVEPGTVWDLEVHGAPQSDAWEIVFHTELGITAGTRDLVLRLADAAR